MSELSERDEWMYTQGYRAGSARAALEGDTGYISPCASWAALDADAADGVSVGMVLAKEAPPATCPHVWTAAEGTSHCTLNGPAPLVWSEEVPTVAGWYWVQFPKCVPYLHYIALPHSDAGVAAPKGVRWAGPIPKPQEPKP